MPKRGANAEWQRAVHHARIQPSDAIALWVCRAGHRYVVVGPPVEYRGMHLVCVKQQSHRAGRELVCSCGERPMNRIPVDRDRIRAAKTLFRLGGLDAVREFFLKTPPPDGAGSEVKLAAWMPFLPDRAGRFHREDAFQHLCEFVLMPITPHGEMGHV